MSVLPIIIAELIQENMGSSSWSTVGPWRTSKGRGYLLRSFDWLQDLDTQLYPGIGAAPQKQMAACAQQGGFSNVKLDRSGSATTTSKITISVSILAVVLGLMMLG